MCEKVKFLEKVPSFEIEIFDPKEKEFGIFSLEQILKERKWLILFFYPGDFTFVCPTELKDLQEVYEEIKKLGGEVLSISTDSKFVHLAWQREEKLLKDVKFPMGSDLGGKISRLFGVLDEKNGVANRGTFIINPDGILVGIEISFDRVGRNAKELLRKLKASIHAYNHPDEVCPAGWEEGKKILKLRKEIVGNVYKELE